VKTGSINSGTGLKKAKIAPQKEKNEELQGLDVLSGRLRLFRLHAYISLTTSLE
jgi:hypothetical protein